MSSSFNWGDEKDPGITEAGCYETGKQRPEGGTFFFIPPWKIDPDFIGPPTRGHWVRHHATLEGKNFMRLR